MLKLPTGSSSHCSVHILPLIGLSKVQTIRWGSNKTFMGKVKEATFCHKTIYRRSVPEGDVGQNMKKVA